MESGSRQKAASDGSSRGGRWDVGTQDNAVHLERIDGSDERLFDDLLAPDEARDLAGLLTKFAAKAEKADDSDDSKDSKDSDSDKDERSDDSDDSDDSEDSDDSDGSEDSEDSDDPDDSKDS